MTSPRTSAWEAIGRPVDDNFAPISAQSATSAIEEIWKPMTSKRSVKCAQAREWETYRS